VLRPPSLGLSLALSLLVFSTLSLARAQNIDGFYPAPDQSGFSGFPSTRPPGPWGTDATLWLHYGLDTFETGGQRPVEHRFDMTVAAQLGILSRGAIAVRMPVLLYQRGDGIPSGLDAQGVQRNPFTVPRSAAGNPAIDGRVRIWGEPAGPNGVVKDGGALALRGVVQLPLGEPKGYFADDKVRTELAAIADIEVFGIVAGAQFSWLHRYGEEERPALPAPSLSVVSPLLYGPGVARDVLKLSAGLRLPLRLITRPWPGRAQEAALLEVDVATAARDFFGKTTTPVEGRLGYRFVFEDVFSTLMVGTRFHDVAGTPDLRVVLGVGYAPRKHDQDGDGVPDSSDQCVHLPEDHDNFQDEDGCADDDNDGDMIVDEDDRCPLVPAEEGRDEDEDGCTD
jgi:hypothetical protein